MATILFRGDVTLARLDRAKVKTNVVSDLALGMFRKLLRSQAHRLPPIPATHATGRSGLANQDRLNVFMSTHQFDKALLYPIHLTVCKCESRMRKVNNTRPRTPTQSLTKTRYQS